MSGKLDYWRADNMWAAAGRPDGNLGQESISLKVGQTRVFVTDWKYEKRKNDGTNYYGSHGRVLRNGGQVPIDVVLKGTLDAPVVAFLVKKIVGVPLGGLVQTVVGDRIRLNAGAKVEIRNDIAEVLVPKLS